MADLEAGVELIVGTTHDHQLGPVALVGLGGVFTEVLRDVSLALAPLTESTALACLRRLRGYPLLTGARGRAPLDLDAAAQALVAVSRFGAEHPELEAVEINPLLVRPRGVLALDARIVLGSRVIDSAAENQSQSPPSTGLEHNREELV